jgi:predicted dehydrogenase
LLGRVDGVVCAGFFDTSAERAAKVAAELNVTAHASLSDLIDSCDALCIVVPTSSHAAVAMEAISKGRHLLVEKPLCVTLDEADTMLDAADRAGVIVQTGHIERFNRAIRAAFPHIEAPRFISSERLAPFNPRGTDVAVVLDLMIHDIDLVLTLLGNDVTAVQAVGVPVLTGSVDIANARVEFAGGAVATITASRASLDKARKLRIFQQSGYLSLDLAAGSGNFFRVRKDAMSMSPPPASLEALVEYVPISAPEGEPLLLELQAFADAVRGKAPVIVTGDDGRAALAVAHRIMSAIEASLLTSRAPGRAARA